MEGETALTSSLGGLLTVGVITFLAVQAIIQSVGMFSHEDPKIIQVNEFQDDPAGIDLNRTKNFFFAIGTTRGGKYINMSENSIMSFTTTYNRNYRAKDGVITKFKSKVHWAPCTESNFPEDVLAEDVYTANNLNYAYCPTVIDHTTTSGTCPDEIVKEYPDCITPPFFALKGAYLSFAFEFIQFKLKSCDQADAALVQGLKCTSENISNVFKTSEIQMNLYFANNLINSVDYNIPNKTYLDTLYWAINPSASRVADIYLDIETVQDFDDYFASDAHKNRSFYSVQAEKVREVQVFQGTNLLEWNLRRSNLNHVTARTYTKVLDVISDIGGISELFMIVTGMLLFGYVKYKYQMILGNRLYDFEVHEKQKEAMAKKDLVYLDNKDSDLDPDSASTGRRSKILPDILGLRRKVMEAKMDMSKRTVKDYFDQQIKRKRILKYSEFDYFKSLFRWILRKKDPEEALAEKARNQIVKDLDIINIVDKLKEVDKLKVLLLNRYQREAFNFIERPVLSLDRNAPLSKGSRILDDIEGQKMNEAAFDTRDEYDSVAHYAKLYKSYQFIKNDPDPRNEIYNTKLLDMIGEELIKVFERVERAMEGDGSPRRFEEVVTKMLSEPMDKPLP